MFNSHPTPPMDVMALCFSLFGVTVGDKHNWSNSVLLFLLPPSATSRASEKFSSLFAFRVHLGPAVPFLYSVPISNYANLHQIL